MLAANPPAVRKPHWFWDGEVSELSDGKHRLPPMDVSENPCFDPYIVLLGAGANLAACHDGDTGFRTMSNRR